MASRETALALTCVIGLPILAACGGGGSTTMVPNPTPQELCETDGGTYADGTCMIAAEAEATVIANAIAAAETAVAGLTAESSDADVAAANALVMTADGVIRGAMHASVDETAASLDDLDEIRGFLAMAQTTIREHRKGVEAMALATAKMKASEAAMAARMKATEARTAANRVAAILGAGSDSATAADAAADAAEAAADAAEAASMRAQADTMSADAESERRTAETEQGKAERQHAVADELRRQAQQFADNNEQVKDDPMPVDAESPEHSASTEWRSNATAEDLLDHWNASDVARGALGLTPVGPTELETRKTAISSLLQMFQGGDSDIDFRNVQAEDIEIIGERGGITYGQWKGGPAGTLNIEFDWQFASGVPASVRAAMERAGKAWSYRLLDDFGTHTIPAGTNIHAVPEHAGAEPVNVTYSEDIETDGVLITVTHTSTDPLSSGGPRDADITPDDYEPWHGLINLSQSNIDERETVGEYWLIYVLAHEVGHVIGVVDHRGGWDVPSVERYIDEQQHTFNGPNMVAANGGQPVPFQWLDADSNPVPPFTAGATSDWSHFGACASIMAYCTDSREVYVPAEIDFAYLDDIGYEVLDADTASDPELYGYGAWATYSAWGAGVERMLDYQDDGTDVSSVDRLRASVNSFGFHPTASFADAHAALEGEATWMGSLIGIDLGSTKLPPVFGDAELSVNLATLAGQAMFDDLTVHDGGVSSSFRAPTLMYDIAVDGNGFSDENGRLDGSFYGPAHEEMAGVLDDRTATVNLLAGFGGIR
ncbi:MAG: hypothetical protein OXI95_00360 [bacterium]|nr:hypothetical protein [bacterium]